MNANNFLEFAVNFQRQVIERTGDYWEKNQKLPETLQTMNSVDVGQTPSEVVYTENKLKLLHYKPLTEQQKPVPILIVYALINRPYILDLQDDRSVVRTLLEHGFDVYLIDWGEPSPLDKNLTIWDYVGRYIDNCVNEVRERTNQDAINLLGYCMGGTMSAMYASIFPDKIKNLLLMASGLSFSGEAGILELWGDEEYYDPNALTDAFGNIPAEFLTLGFDLMNPVENFVTKYIDLFEGIENEDFVKNFARMNQWIYDGIDVAGSAYKQFIEDIYQDNKLMKNELELNGHQVDLNKITMPVLQIIGEYDHLIPPQASKPFNDKIPGDDNDVFEFPTGHIGLSVSSHSQAKLWPRVCDWLAKRSNPSGHSNTITDNPEAASPQNSHAEADDSSESTLDLESIYGIGSVYAGRLTEAGITNASDLAERSVEEIMDTAHVSETRARDWLNQAQKQS